MQTLRPTASPRPPHDLAAPIDHIRTIPRRDILPPEVRRRIAGQNAVAGGLLLAAAQKVGVEVPEAFLWPSMIPPGWWWSADFLGHCTPSGHVTMPAVGVIGADLDGMEDHRLVGLAPQPAAVIAVHEIGHALHFLRLGPERAAAMIAEAGGRDADMPGWADLCRELSAALFGRELPSGYNFARWPSRAPGSLPLVDEVAGMLAKHAVGPVDEAEAKANVQRADAGFATIFNMERAVGRLLARLGGGARA
jgi:hypothetical protein